jgi:hypothetical protein
MSATQLKTTNQLKFDKEDFKSFLSGLLKVSDTAILHVESDQIYAISASEDRSLFLWSTLEGDFDHSAVLNLPSLKKLYKALDLVPDKTVTFTNNSNNLEFKGSKVKFKYHLYGDGILVAPKLTLTKIKSLKYEHKFIVEKEFLKQITKNSSVFNDTNKLYIFTHDDHLVWSLGDKTMTNTDVLTFVGDKVDFEMDEFILNLDNVRLLSIGKETDFTMEVNKMGIGKISLKNGEAELNYILSSLTK